MKKEQEFLEWLVKNYDTISWEREMDGSLKGKRGSVNFSIFSSRETGEIIIQAYTVVIGGMPSLSSNDYETVKIIYNDINKKMTEDSKEVYWDNILKKLIQFE